MRYFINLEHYNMRDFNVFSFFDTFTLEDNQNCPSFWCFTNKMPPRLYMTKLLNK